MQKSSDDGVRSDAGNRLLYRDHALNVEVEVLPDLDHPDVLLYVARRAGEVTLKAHRRGSRSGIHHCTDRAPVRTLQYYQAGAMTELPVNPRLELRVIDDLRNHTRVYLAIVGKSGGIAIDVVDA